MSYVSKFSVDYTNKQSLEALASYLECMMPAQKASAVKRIIEANLMTPPLKFRIVRFIFRKKIFDMAMRELLTEQRAAAIEIWDQTIRHLISGHDAYDRRSAGGFCKDELQRLSQIVHGTGYESFEVIG